MKQEKKKPIKTIKCPECQEKYLVKRLMKSHGLNRMLEEVQWICKNPDCHKFYPENFFDVFPQYEKYVERYK